GALAGVDPKPPAEAVPVSARTTDLPRRLAPAAVMLGLAAVPIGPGGRVRDALIVAVALVAFAECVQLIMRATDDLALRAAGVALGLAYSGAAAAVLIGAGTFLLILVIGIAVFTDTGAYFA